MKVLKFGGSSVRDGRCFLSICELIESRSNEGGLAVVLSAPQGVTNQLVALVDEAELGEELTEKISALKSRFQGIADEIHSENKSFDQEKFRRFCTEKIDELHEKLKGISLLKRSPDAIRAQIISLGERISVSLMSITLESRKHSVLVLDPSQFLISEGDYLEGVVDIEASKEFLPEIPPQSTILMAGFIARNRKGELVVLGRNGSDYSAASLSPLIHASMCEIWTDVNGAYTGDPRFVENVQHVTELSYEEALDISYFGAKVLHPKTITPLAMSGIPCLIKNTNEPDSRGTLIQKEFLPEEREEPPIKAVCDLRDVILVTITVHANAGRTQSSLTDTLPGRVQALLVGKGVPIILFVESSSSNSVTFAILEIYREVVETLLSKGFELELLHQVLLPISYQSDMAVVSIIGDNMRLRRGTAATLFSALAQRSINVAAIAQGASERNISVVIRNERVQQAVVGIHEAFFQPYKEINLIILGLGSIGKEFLRLIERQEKVLKNQGVRLHLISVANSRKMLFSKKGLNLKDLSQKLEESNEKMDLAVYKRELEYFRGAEVVMMDVSSSSELARRYPLFLKRRVHIICANKHANTGSIIYYKELREIAQKMGVRLLYETNVGAGLPVMTPLRHLIQTGDTLKQVRGILSGSLSYIFGKLDEGVPFSQIVQEAKKSCFTEPDPREDLSGNDVARKLLLLVREAGFHYELKDIVIEKALPPKFNEEGDIETFMSRIAEGDDYFAARVKEAKKKGAVLRYVAEFRGRKLNVGIQEVEQSDPLAGVLNGENALEIHTEAYSPTPLRLRGYGAGKEVTAAGLFSDLLQVVEL